MLLPYLEANTVYDKFDPSDPWDAPAHAAAVRDWSGARLFQCPDWTRERWAPTPETPTPERGHLAHSNSVGVAGLGPDAATLPADDPRAGMFGHDRRLKTEQVKDGTSNTALILETGRDVGPWLRGGPATVRGVDPGDHPLTGDGRAFGGTHFRDSTVLRRKKPTGANVLLADGAVRHMLDATDPAVLAALATVAGGEPAPAGW